ncbi:hypothetical protein V490_07244 [Pseudogymnoascus sp. VKM F-3557]|nr:hypothetical protein V490_07244 [Pseudogymnoascus sp. VKM F-3557]
MQFLQFLPLALATLATAQKPQIIFYSKPYYEGTAARIVTIDANNDKCVDIYPILRTRAESAHISEGAQCLLFDGMQCKDGPVNFIDKNEPILVKGRQAANKDCEGRELGTILEDTPKLKEEDLALQ